VDKYCNDAQGNPPTESSLIPGSLSHFELRDRCESCQIGKFSTGGGSCQNCAAGKSTSAAGSTSEVSCVNCEDGKTSVRNRCESCQIGKFSTGGGSCQNCAAGKSTSAAGSTSEVSCENCEDGKTSVAGSNCKTSCSASNVANSDKASGVADLMGVEGATLTVTCSANFHIDGSTTVSGTVTCNANGQFTVIHCVADATCNDVNADSVTTDSFSCSSGTYHLKPNPGSEQCGANGCDSGECCDANPTW